MVYVFTLLTILPYYIQTTPLEAAFQGILYDPSRQPQVHSVLGQDQYK